jgi:glutathionyl-hydroquinone reductase
MPPPTLSTTPTVLAAWFCPFAQRTLIAAKYKQVCTLLHVSQSAVDASVDSTSTQDTAAT